MSDMNGSLIGAAKRQPHGRLSSADQQKPLAVWLQRHFSRFQKPFAVAELYRLFGSTTKRLVDFR